MGRPAPRPDAGSGKKLERRIGEWGFSIQTGAELENPDPPDAAIVMMKTRALNNSFGTSFTFEEVAEMDDMLFWLYGRLIPIMNPEKPKKG